MNMLSDVNIEFLDDLDPVLYKQMIYDIKHDNYEFCMVLLVLAHTFFLVLTK